MSEAALLYVRGCTHPAVKDGTRDLFEAIAHFVPAGETTTPLIGMDALATQARRHRRTVVKRLADLVEIGEVEVIDGGLGRIARYNIVHLDGARPIVATPLPLRADLQAVERRAPRLPDDTTGDLFADPPASVRSNDEKPVLIDHRLPANLWRSFTGWVLYLCKSITGWRSDGEKPVLIDHRLPIAAAVLTTARDVHTFKNVHTHDAARDGPTTAEENPSPPRHPWHAWCGRVCVPKELHQEFLRKGHDATWLIAFYGRTCLLAAGEKIHVNDFTFWRTALKAELATRAAPARAPTSTPRRASTFGAENMRCPHDPRCPTFGACTERVLAEGRAERERQTG